MFFDAASSGMSPDKRAEVELAQRAALHVEDRDESSGAELFRRGGPALGAKDGA